MAFLNTEKGTSGIWWHLKLPENVSHSSLHLKHGIRLELILPKKEKSEKFLLTSGALSSPPLCTLILIARSRGWGGVPTWGSAPQTPPSPGA